jgi:hypothetical protein
VLATSLAAQTRKVQNRPYIDQRRWHYGFLVALSTQDYKLTNTGCTTADGEAWFADVPGYSAGFGVGVLGELYLQRFVSLRFIPSLSFGEKSVTWREQSSGETTVQNVKSTYLSAPVDVKLSAERFNNYRPYVVCGLAPALDLTTKKGRALRVKPFDCMVELGMGCDIYLPYFKLIPELKFGFGLLNIVSRNRSDLTDLSLTKYRDAVSEAKSRTISLTFYFE